LPPNERELKSAIQNAIQTCIEELLANGNLKFFTHNSISCPIVKIESKNLASCWKFNVHDEKDKKVLTVKVYDKIADMVGREGVKLVGSNLSKVVGSCYNLDVMSKKVRAAKNHGITRVEVSFYFDDSDEYRFGQPFMNNMFHSNASILLKRITTKVINEPTIHDQVCRRLDIFKLLHAFQTLKTNVLVIGRSYVWLLACGTCHPQHFVGTQRSLVLKP
jgi:hypothetical protein